MVVQHKMAMDDLRPEAKYAVERWIVTSDPKYRKHYFAFFNSRPQDKPVSSHSSTRKLPNIKSPSKSLSAPEKAELDAAQKELDMANWNTTYAITAKAATINTSPKKKPAAHGRIMLQLAQDLFKPHAMAKVKLVGSECNDEEMADMTTLMRSLSIATEQQRTSFSSEYVVQYVPKEYIANSVSVEDARSSSLTGPVTWAPPKQHTHFAPVEHRQRTPVMARPAPKPQAQKGLLSWPGDNQSTSTYRHHFRKMGENYPQVIPDREMLSFACGRSVPDCLVSDHARFNPVLMPCETESRHILRQRHPSSSPSFHLLYKDGVIFTQDPGKHNPGDRTVYMADFVQQSSVVKQSKPTLDPFGSSITISMSDHPYHTTTYQAGICRSANMEYDRSLV